MAVQIVINQVPQPPGIPGQAREDLATGVPVDLAAVGGPFLQYLWTIIDKPIDYVAAAQSGAFLTAPNAPATQVNNVDFNGTYEVQLSVDSGSGLGATPDDVTRITFYAGIALNPIPSELPRRVPAFGEQTEHNAPDPIFPGGNPRGWAQELGRWFEVISRFGFFAGVRWNDAGGLIVAQKNVLSVVPGLPGIYTVNFTNPAANADYLVIAAARGALGGFATAQGEALNSFQLYRTDPFGVLANGDFNLVVVSFLL